MKKPRHRYQAPPPNAVQYKTWLADEAERIGTTARALWMRIKRGRYPKPTMWRGGRQRDEFVIPSTP